MGRTLPATAASLVVDKYRLRPEQEVTYGLLRDECITIARKPVATGT